MPTMCHPMRRISATRSEMCRCTYDQLLHIGYDKDGKKIARPAGAADLDAVLAARDDPNFKWTVHDDYNGENMSFRAGADAASASGRRLQSLTLSTIRLPTTWTTTLRRRSPLSAACQSAVSFCPSTKSLGSCASLVKSRKGASSLSARRRRQTFSSCGTTLGDGRREEAASWPSTRCAAENEDTRHAESAETSASTSSDAGGARRVGGAGSRGQTVRFCASEVQVSGTFLDTRTSFASASSDASIFIPAVGFSATSSMSTRVPCRNSRIRRAGRTRATSARTSRSMGTRVGSHFSLTGQWLLSLRTEQSASGD